MTKLAPFRPDGSAASPVRRVVRTRAPHGVEPNIVVSVYPNGTIGLRESGRAVRTEKVVEAGQLYVQLVQAAVLKMGRRIAELKRAGHTRGEARKIARKEASL